MGGPAPIRQAFAAAVENVKGVRAVMDHDPGQSRLPKLPCVTMMFVGFEQRDEATGPMQTVDWHWNVYVYVDFGQADKAQEQLELILPGIAAVVRDDTGLDGTCEKASITDALDTPELNEQHKWLRKRLRLVAEREELTV